MVEIAGWRVLFIEVEASIFRLYERGYDHAQIGDLSGCGWW